jgi:hypothetical protein
MASNRITSGGAKRSGGGSPRRSRGALALVAALALAAAVAGCGGGSSSSTTTPAAAPASQGNAQDVSAPTPSADALVLDKVLGRQEAAAAAYSKVTPSLSAAFGRRALIFRRQEEEHIDATIKALRGLKAHAEPTVEPIAVPEMKTEPEALEFLYDVEGATIDEELSAIGKLESTWPRSLLASVVANQAQHRTLLRQMLGAGPLASVPEAFENGTAPPPGSG